MQDGWFNWAYVEAGPPERVIYGDNSLSVIIGHSLEGRRGGYSAMFDPARFPTAWHGTVGYDGELYQHYPITAGLAASGAGNLSGPAFEAEGFAGEPLNDAQVETYLRIIRDMEALAGKLYRPGVPREGFTEHNQWAQTACPSGRYQPLYDAIAAGALEESMTPAEKEEMAALRARRELAALCADLNSYAEVLDLYQYATSKGYLP